MNIVSQLNPYLPKDLVRIVVDYDTQITITYEHLLTNKTRRYGFRHIIPLILFHGDYVELSYGDVDDLNCVFDCTHIVQSSAFIIDDVRVDRIKLCSVATDPERRSNCAQFDEGHPQTFPDGSWHNFYQNDAFIVKDLLIAEELLCYGQDSQLEEEYDESETEELLCYGQDSQSEEECDESETPP